MKALLSIKPEFVEKIFSGEKRFEYRKVAFTQQISKIVIYATSPVCRIVGEFDVEEIIESTPSSLWEQTKKDSGVTQRFFFQYFEGRKSGVAIRISGIKRYAQKINPYESWEGFSPPQSFRYIRD